MKELFSFKRFNIDQKGSAMKVGTDGVLLGGWASVEHDPFSVLDIGAGTGIIALMLAQRSDAETVDALEIDETAYEQCVENFEASPWGDRLFCYHAGLDEFVEEWNDTYDLIVSNPPFFEPDAASTAAPPLGTSTRAVSRRTARFYDSLPFDALLEGASRLLSPEGIFCTIVPYGEEDTLLALGSDRGLHPQKITRVRGNPTSKIKRSLLQFGRTEAGAVVDELVIELERHRYTEEYRELTKDFYLKM